MSKFNHHFATVVGVMTSNHPILQPKWLRRRVYKRYPEDVRPAAYATALAHFGTLLEILTPVVLAFAVGGWPLTIGLVGMLGLHFFIFSNMPMAVPLEWNVMAVYGGFALFYAHPEVSFWQISSVPVALVLLTTLVLVPLLGNLFPERLSFLVSMRYYAGNWPYSVWLFRGNSAKKMQAITMSAPWVYAQLERLYPPHEARSVVSKVMGFRMMHLQGRALSELLPKAVDDLGAYD